MRNCYIVIAVPLLACGQDDQKIHLYVQKDTEVCSTTLACTTGRHVGKQAGMQIDRQNSKQTAEKNSFRQRQK